ncbi:MAG: LPS export ABC transporter permease LptF [bacterium]
MKTLTRYIIKELIPPFFLSLFVITFLLLSGKIFDLTELFITKGIPAKIIGQLLLYILPSFFAITIPISVLVAVLMALGRLSSENEIIAIKTSGINLIRLFTPVIVISVFISLFMFWFNNNILPKSNFAFKNLYYTIVQKKAEVVIKEKVFIDDFDKLVIYIGSMDEKKSRLYNVFIQKFEPHKPRQTIIAKEAELISNPDERKVTMKLYNGTAHECDEKNMARYHKIAFETYNINIDINQMLGQIADIRKGDREMNMSELKEEAKKAGELKLKTGFLWVEYYKKSAIAFACTIFAIIGLPLGVMAKKSGRAIGIFTSIFLSFVYYLFLIGGETLGDRGKISPFLSMWSANVILGIIGIILLIVVVYEKNPLFRIKGQGAKGK